MEFSHEVVVTRVVVIEVVIAEVVVLSPLRFWSATVIGGIINTQNLSPLFSACVDGGLLTPLISPLHISLCKGCDC